MQFQSMDFGQEMRQRQTMALSQQMRRSLEVLAMPSAELRLELRKALESNPAIEDIRYGGGDVPLSAAAPDEHTADSPADRELNFDATPERMEAILSADDGYRDSYLAGMQSASGDDEADAARERFLDSRLKKPKSLQEHLLAQLPVSGIPQTDLPLARMLVGNIDEDGFFAGSVPDIAMVARTTPEHIADVLALVKRLDPPGCGSANRAEYLLGRLAEIPAERRDDARKILADTALFAPGTVASPAKRMRQALEESGLTQERFSAALAAIGELDPCPAGAFDDGGETVRETAPDVFLAKAPDGSPDVIANPREIPAIRFSERFKQLARRKDLSPDEAAYVRGRLAAAMELAAAVERRADTVHDIAHEIVKAQDAFFRTGDMAALRPLSMTEIARKTGVHEATVSRTVNGKYIMTPWGLFELRRFFASGPAGAGEGADGASSAAIEEMIKRLVADEDASAPLSDEAIARKLTEGGVKIARRTVAKYRARAGIPGTAERKSGFFQKTASDSPGRSP